MCSIFDLGHSSFAADRHAVRFEQLDQYRHDIIQPLCDRQRVDLDHQVLAVPIDNQPAEPVRAGDGYRQAVLVDIGIHPDLDRLDGGGRVAAAQLRMGAQPVEREGGLLGLTGAQPEVQVEATFPDGTKLVTVHDPIV